MKIQALLLLGLVFIAHAKFQKKAKKTLKKQGEEQLQKTYQIINDKGVSKPALVTEFNPNKKLCSQVPSVQEKFCNSLTDCAICNKALNCGYCEQSKRCLAGGPDGPFCYGDCLIGWNFDVYKCSNTQVFGNVFTKAPEASGLISAELTGPKIKLNVQHKNHLKKSLDVLAGQQSIIQHLDKDGVVKHQEVHSPIRYQLYTTMPTETIDESYIFDNKNGKRLDVSLASDVQTHGADVE